MRWPQALLSLGENRLRKCWRCSLSGREQAIVRQTSFRTLKRAPTENFWETGLSTYGLSRAHVTLFNSTTNTLSTIRPAATTTPTTFFWILADTAAVCDVIVRLSVTIFCRKSRLIMRLSFMTMNQLSSPRCSTRAIHRRKKRKKTLFTRMYGDVSEKKRRQNGPLAEKCQDRKRKKTRQKNERGDRKGTNIKTLRFRNRREPQTSPASLRGHRTRSRHGVFQSTVHPHCFKWTTKASSNPLYTRTVLNRPLYTPALF